MISDVMNRPDWINSEVYPFNDNWMMIKGHTIHYLDEGPRNKPVLLYIHPGPGWSFTYRYHIRKLRDEFRCVAPDLPGYGLSKAADDYKYTLLEQSRVLEEFVKTLDLRRIIPWVNDGGGPTAILGLASQSDRVIGLVVGGTFGWSIKQYHSVTRMLRLFTSPVFRVFNRYTNLLPWTIGTMGLGSRSMPKEERRYYSLPFKERNSRNHTLKLFRSFLDPTTQQALDESLRSFHDKPVLIQFGENDPMTGQGWPERWAAELPDHEIHIIPRVKHFTFEDAPETTVEKFRAWWAGLEISHRYTQLNSVVQ